MQKAMSVKEITTYHTYNNGLPVKGGLNDPALGVIDKRATCTTCKNTYGASGVNDCPGHFGHLQVSCNACMSCAAWAAHSCHLQVSTFCLAMRLYISACTLKRRPPLLDHRLHVQLESPVFHIGYLNTVYKLIQCVCINCSRVLADRNDPDFASCAKIRNGKKRLMAMMRLCKSKSKCLSGAQKKKSAFDDANMPQEVDAVDDQVSGCGVLQPKFRRNGLKIEMEYPENNDEDMMGLADRKQSLSPAQAYEVFARISDDDARLLGLDPRFARPEWLLLTVLPISPPHVRPSVALDALTRGDDDITHKYADIIKANMELSKAKKSGRTALEIEQYEALLQYHCATLIDNQLPGQPTATQRGGKALKTFRERLVGKGGRIRGNLMGKRVDFSGRTVITADPILSIHQVGVPRTIASNLTVPEVVNRWNIRKLQALVDRGPYEWPGAKYIMRDNGARIDLRFAKTANDRSLKYGWIVERHLMDDDTVLFNRQPSLHKMSIMCHRAKVLDYSTFRLNLTCTTPYNADFDGG